MTDREQYTLNAHRIALNYVWGMRQSSAYDEEGGEFSPPTGTNET